MEKLPKLDERLTAIASMVRPGVSCADIGTDHGYLIAWLAASGRIPAGFACDINRKPLEKAAFALSEYGVADRVRLILCDGLSGLRAGDAQDIIIAGMGGDLIWEIIAAKPWTRDKNLRFLLQPMTKPEHLRRRLYENGFCILQEKAAVSGGFPYGVMQAAYCGEPAEISPEFAYCGLLLEDESSGAQTYVKKQRLLIGEKVAGLQKAERPGRQLEEYRALLHRLESRCSK